jgi:hypothetical protein
MEGGFDSLEAMRLRQASEYVLLEPPVRMPHVACPVRHDLG